MEILYCLNLTIKPESRKIIWKITKYYYIEAIISYTKYHMKKWVFQTFLKFIMLSWVFFVLINYFWYFLSAEQSNQSLKNSNQEKYVSSNMQVIGNVWVAISTNIWTRFTQTNNNPTLMYNDVVEIGYILWNQKIAKESLIQANMLFLNEYFQILQTDIRWLLSSSTDRSFALNAFIAQLEYRYKSANSNAQKLTTQKQELLKAFEQSNKEIEKLKLKIWDDFSTFNNKETIRNIDNYLEVKQENTHANTYIVFIDKFLHYYEILNDYNKKVLDTLINNKEILIKNTQVVIPDTGWELLKQLQLLYTEEEWKSGK